jgi:hypothetical protein
MNISDIFPPNGEPQRIYCQKCGAHTELTYVDFNEDISGITIRIDGLPTLRCPACGNEHLPDQSRLPIIETHKRAFERSAPGASVRRRKRTDKFGFTKIDFIYDPDDYFYIPGLVRPWESGFLQPVFFNRSVLLKYDNHPEYRVQFASTTYGTIYPAGNYISFGINRHGNVVMWLGDIAKLPEAEQHYLRSENVESDHSIGSEFYDGQIEVKFTDPSTENKLFKLRSEFIEAVFNKVGVKIAHLDKETFDVAREFNSSSVDTPKERHHVADALNKIYIESLDNKALESACSKIGASALGTGSLKRLQAIMERIAPGEDVASILSPLFVLYDLRVAYSHLTSHGTAQSLLATIGKRLEVPADSSLSVIYEQLTQRLIEMFEKLTTIAGTASSA